MEKAGDQGVHSTPFPPLVPSLLESNNLSERSMTMRPGFGTSGKQVSLVTNNFKVSLRNSEIIFYQYSVSIVTGDNGTLESPVRCRRVIDKLYEIYSTELSGKGFVYDGRKSLYTVGPLPKNRFDFTVVLDESIAIRSCCGNINLSEYSKRSKYSIQSTTFIVDIVFATTIPLHSINFQEGQPNKAQDALRVLNTMLQQLAAKRGCLLVRQSFFNDDSSMFTDVGGGVMSLKGLHSSFCQTIDGLSLNIDVSTTMIVKPGSVVDFLLTNQNVKEAHKIDWVKAQKMLKNLKVKTKHNNMEFKISGLSHQPCNQQNFTLKVKTGSGAMDGGTMDITVYDYFVKHRNIKLESSAYMPCLDVGKPKKPVYLPVELCFLVSLQRYKKALSVSQRQTLFEKSRQMPRERIQIIKNAVRNYAYDENPIFLDCDVSIEKNLVQVDGRVLNTPKLKIGGNEECVPQNGRWNFTNKKQLFEPCRIERWALVNFSASCDISHLSRELIDCGRKRGIHIERPYTFIEEDPKYRNACPVIRVKRMFEQIFDKLPGAPELLLCVLQERKNSSIYGPWKKKCLIDMGFMSQCISPIKINDQYLTNVLLKINSKLGGINSMLEIEHSRCVPVITDKPTMIIGMDVSHGSPAHTDSPSIVAVVGSRCWPLISKYRAAMHTQSSKAEMIECLFKPLANGDDGGIMRELLQEFYNSSNGVKPTQIIVFRDGVSESQFSQVINVELGQIIKAYRHLGGSEIPKFTVIVVQKNHHTRFFQASAFENVPPGTVVDRKVVHPRKYDFYICPHAGVVGTCRPAHYHVLLDEIGFSPNDLQNLIHSLSYVTQRSSAATSIVAPVWYAHLAARQAAHFLKPEDAPNALSTHKNEASEQSTIKLHEDVAGSMFFC